VCVILQMLQYYKTCLAVLYDEVTRQVFFMKY